MAKGRAKTKKNRATKIAFVFLIKGDRKLIQELVPNKHNKSKTHEPLKIKLKDLSWFKIVANQGGVIHPFQQA